MSFNSVDFRQLIHGAEKSAAALLTNLQNNGTPSAPAASTPSDIAFDYLVTDVADSGEVLTRTADVSNLH